MKLRSNHFRIGNKLLPIVLISMLMMAACQEDTFLDEENQRLKSESVSENSGYVTFFEKEFFIRLEGKPIWITRKIGNSSISDYEPCFKLYVRSGFENAHYVSSAIVRIDGKEILVTSDFNNEKNSYQFDLCELTESSVLELVINGAPGSTLEVWIEGKPLLPSFVFTKTIDGIEQIFSANQDFSQVKQLTSADVNCMYPRISPDGKKITYTKGIWEHRQIWIIDSDGSNDTQVTYSDLDKDFSAWHDNGVEIIYECNTGGSKTVAQIVAIDGTNDRTLIDVGNKVRWPIMNPSNENQIVFYFDYGNDAFSSDLRIRDLESSSDVIIVNADGWAKNNCKFSHNGQYVIWMDINWGEGLRLKTVNTSTLETNVIESIPNVDGNLLGVYSIDDQYIFHLKKLNSPVTEVIMRNADGTNPVVIYTGENINWIDVR